MKILSELYGHMGSASTHPCWSCESPKVSFRANINYPLRTPYSIDQGRLQHLYYFTPEMNAKQRLELTKNTKSISKEPLLQVPICNVIPPSLHIVQGLAQNLIKIIESMFPLIVPALEKIYKSLGADKQAFYQTFTGNFCLLYIFRWIICMSFRKSRAKTFDR